MTELEACRKTAGMQSGNHNVEQVREIFGVNVVDFPQLFIVWRSGLVSKKERNGSLYQDWLKWQKHNWTALGIASQ